LGLHSRREDARNQMKQLIDCVKSVAKTLNADVAKHIRETKQKEVC